MGERLHLPTCAERRIRPNSQVITSKLCPSARGEGYQNATSAFKPIRRHLAVSLKNSSNCQVLRVTTLHSTNQRLPQVHQWSATTVLSTIMIHGSGCWLWESGSTCPPPYQRMQPNTGHHTEGLSYAGTKPEWFEYQRFDLNLRAPSITEQVGKGAHIVRLIEDSALLSSLFSAYILENGLLSRLRSG